MPISRSIIVCFFLSVFILALLSSPALAAKGAAPQEGDTLPSLSLITPPGAKDKKYLGLSGDENFDIKDIKAKLVLIEIVGVYCPFCHKQAPGFNSLFKRIKRAKLAKDIKMVGLASGATPEEIKYLRGQSNYAYPILRDQDYSVHKQLGEPQTPYTMLVNSNGEVLFSHKGVIEDIDGLFARMKELAQ